MSGLELPALEMVIKRFVRRIIADQSHQEHDLFQLLPAGRRHAQGAERGIARTNRLSSRFFRQAVGALNLDSLTRD